MEEGFMKDKAIFIANSFYYSLIILAIISIVAVIFTPARSFLAYELKRSARCARELAIKSFDKKLALAGKCRQTFEPVIMIRKSRRELVVLSGSIPVVSYPAGFGRSPAGIKLNADDNRTPEGNYYVCYKTERHRYGLFLQINYPSPDDARRGVVQQLIVPGEKKELIEAFENREIPNPNTALGGNIGIHGYGAESNWTIDGSVSLHSRHMEELYWNIPKGTPVAIVP